MGNLVRFTVSLDEELFEQFDREWQSEGFPTRSEAVKAMIRRTLVEKEWHSGKEVAGAILLVYDHHEKAVANELIDIQHDFEKVVIATQHAHLDHDNCLESVLVKGKALDIDRLVKRIKSVKGVKHTALMMTTTGRNMR
jgi:CopG family nickel-responsive transcriptional regulator